jgi:hypothetical protein
MGEILSVYHGQSATFPEKRALTTLFSLNGRNQASSAAAAAPKIPGRAGDRVSGKKQD